MRIVFSLAVAAAAVVTHINAAVPKVDGWFPCSDVTFASEEPQTSGSGSSTKMTAECATFKAPLCYDGICDDANSTQIDIFVKRIVAVNPGKPNIFFMQGGPGAASPAMESAMTSIYSILSGNVNVYTMDHRGTGRSTKLDCVAAQAMTSGSPGGSSIDPSEVPSCAADLESKYGTDISAFSITSAASDLKLFISSFLTKQQTFVYGVSYGSSLVERLIHLNTPGIAGYILDGISTTSGSDVKNFEYFSKWDVDYDQVGQYFLSFCAQNQADCGQYFPGTTVSEALRTLTATIDSPKTKCSDVADQLLAGLLGYTPGSAPPSQGLRMFMGGLLMDAKLRNLIPVVTYRLTRCNDDDINVLAHLFQRYAEYSNQPDEDSAYTSDLIYKIIVYSEFWEEPTPSEATMLARFMNTTISSGSFSEVETYCVFTKDNSTGCQEFANETTYDAAPLVYQRDKYWNVAAKPPSDVSVLLMSSKMDPQTPHKYAEWLTAALDTDNKHLVVFDQATHGTLWSTPLSNTDPDAPICGMTIVASYVAVGGDLNKVDLSCVAKMPTVSYKVSDNLVKNWLNTTSAVDGPFVGDASNGSGSNGTSYKTVFIVFLVLFILALLAAIAFLFKWRRAKKTSNLNNAIPVTPAYEETQA